MTAAELTNLQQSLRQLLVGEDLTALLAALKQHLPPATAKWNAVFLLETRLNMANKDRIRGIFSREDMEIAYNRIAADLLDLINGLEPADFEPAPSGEGQAANKQTGSILYRIPHTMEVEEEYRCVVRLAFDEASILQDIELTDDTVLKPVRVSEVMEVELVDPNDTAAFAIRRISSTEQFLEKNTYTEWLFMVKPQRTGKLPLMLKVAVKEWINDRERRREIVLEETILVIAEAAETPEPATGFQTAGYFVSYSTAPAAPKPGKAFRRTIMALAAVLAAVGIWAAGFELLFKPKYYQVSETGDEDGTPTMDSVAWQLAKQTGTDSSFNAYLWQYPNGLFRAAALDSLASTAAKDTAQTRPKPGNTSALPNKSAPEVKANSNSLTPPQSTTTPAKKEAVPAETSKRKSGFEMVSIDGGSYQMGHGDGRECAHTVQVKSFKMGKYEVTQADWRDIMGEKPSFHTWCPECPVEQVSWDEVQIFLKTAAEKRKKRYRLPTEAEWEYAARGGKKSQGFQYAGSDKPTAVAHFNRQPAVNRVGTKSPNELGLFDLSGNVREWCADIWGPYPNCKGKVSEKERVVRGGSWYLGRQDLRVYARASLAQNNSNDPNTGFRLVEE